MWFSQRGAYSIVQKLVYLPVYRGSNMSARFLIELEKSDSIRGLASILSRFATSLIKK